MSSNFEFLNDDPLTQQYYISATNAEKAYALGLYPGEKVSIRIVAENLARDIADQEHLSINEHTTFSKVLLPRYGFIFLLCVAFQL